MVAQLSQPPQGGNEGSSSHNSSIFMCKEYVNVTTWAKYYDVPESRSPSKESSTPPTSIGSLTFDNLVESIYHPPKGVLQKTTHNHSTSLLKTIVFLKIFPRLLMPCLLWRYCKYIPRNTKPFCLPLVVLTHTTRISSFSMLINLPLIFHIRLIFNSFCIFTIGIFIEIWWMMALPHVSCIYPSGRL